MGSEELKIVIDGDGCPVIKIVEKIACEYQIELIVVCDVNHYLKLDYGIVKIVDQGNDQVDYEILKLIQKDDLVITQDYGLASLVLAKKCKALNQNGIEYHQNNIDAMLFSRYVGVKLKNSKNKTHLKGPKKRTREDDEHFKQALIKMLHDKKLH